MSVSAGTGCAKPVSSMIVTGRRCSDSSMAGHVDRRRDGPCGTRRLAREVVRRAAGADHERLALQRDPDVEAVRTGLERPDQLLARGFELHRVALTVRLDPAGVAATPTLQHDGHLRVAVEAEVRIRRRPSLG